MGKFKLIVMAAAIACATALGSCENVKTVGGNQMAVGSKTYYYALVYSKITETKYYHIQGWREYGPDGAYMGSGGELGNYVGIELQLMNGDVVYRYEPELAYEFAKNINPEYVKTYGVIGD